MVTLTWKSPGELIVYFTSEKSKDKAVRVPLYQGVNTLTEEEWNGIKNHPIVRSALDAGNLVKGVDSTVKDSEAAKNLTKPMNDLSSKMARDLIPTVTDGAVLAMWLKQEMDKGRRAEVLTALRTQLKLVSSQVAA